MTEAVALDAVLLRDWPLPLDDHGDKFDRGTTLVIGGSAATPGAVLLAGTAALRMGAGRLQIATHRDVASDVAIAMPEAMVVPLHDDWSELARTAQSVLLGPGLDPDDAPSLLESVIQHVAPGATVVLDAAALAALPVIAPRWPDGNRAALILTPNRQEAAALWTALSDEPEGDTDAAAAFDSLLERIAIATNGVVTSFGSVCAPEGRRWRAEDGGPGLSTSGSGDVLAGLVAGAAARTRDPAQAACWATFTHAAAARHLTARTGGIGFLARELADAVGPGLADHHPASHQEFP